MEEIISDFPLLPIVAEWLRMIDRAQEDKQENFWQYAEEALNFFDGPNNWMWEDEQLTKFLSDEYSIRPGARMQVNRVSEAVDLMMPSLYQQNPYRSVKPQFRSPIPPEALGVQMDPMTGMPTDPMAMMMYQALQMEDFQEAMRRTTVSSLMHDLLNYTPNELDLKGNSRRVVEECLVTGMGMWWHQVYQPIPNSPRLVGSFYEPVRNLQLDPDAQQWEDAYWIAIKCEHPLWRVEQTYGIPKGMLKKLGKGSWESITGQSRQTPLERQERREGVSNDMLTYWKIFSKMGFGDRGRSFGNPDLQGQFDMFGDNCFLVISKDIPFPLNFHPWLYESGDTQGMMQAVQWPIPFWADGRWPVTPIKFKQKPGELWPTSIFKPAMGELRFLNWAYSFLADAVAATGGTICAIAKAAGDKIIDQIKSGNSPVKYIEIEELLGKSVNEIVSYINAPPFNGDIFRVIAMVEHNFDRRVGVSDNLAGLQGDSQDRSAAESSIRQGNATARIDDKRVAVEDAATEVARCEALASRWVYDENDLLPVLGQVRTMLWMQHVAPTDILSTVREYDYRIEAGSMAKPNIATDLQQMNEAVQVWGPLLSPFAQMGQVGPINQLMVEWGKARGRDMSPYQIQPPMMPPPGAEGQGDQQPPSDKGGA